MWGGDLRIAFRNTDDTWETAEIMGPVVNIPAIDFCPALSPNGRHLIFTSRRIPTENPAPVSYGDLAEGLRDPLNGSANLWWVDASVIVSSRGRQDTRPERGLAEFDRLMPNFWQILVLFDLL